jgi:hypothetical protein
MARIAFTSSTLSIPRSVFKYLSEMKQVRYEAQRAAAREEHGIRAYT